MSTIGTWVSDARIKQTAKATPKTRTRAIPTDEGNGDGVVFVFGLVSQRLESLADTLVVAGFRIHQLLSRRIFDNLLVEIKVSRSLVERHRS